jgi:hypothetical protein
MEDAERYTRSHSNTLPARVDSPRRQGADRGPRAELITHMLAGVMRRVGTDWARRMRDGLDARPPDGPAFRRCSPQPSADWAEWHGLCSAESDASEFAAHNGVPGMRRVAVHGFR